MPQKWNPSDQHMPVTGPSENRNTNGWNRRAPASCNGRQRGRGCRRGRARERRGVPRANPKVIRNYANQKRRRRMCIADTRTTFQRFCVYQEEFRNFRIQQTRQQRSEYGISPGDIFYLTSSDLQILKIPQKILNRLNLYAEDSPFEPSKALRQFTGLTGIQLKTTGRFLSALANLVQRDLVPVILPEEHLEMVDDKFEQMMNAVDQIYSEAVELLGRVTEMELENVISEQENTGNEAKELAKSDSDDVNKSENNTGPGSVLPLMAAGMGIIILGFLWKYR